MVLAVANATYTLTDAIIFNSILTAIILAFTWKAFVCIPLCLRAVLRSCKNATNKEACIQEKYIALALLLGVAGIIIFLVSWWISTLEGRPLTFGTGLF